MTHRFSLSSIVLILILILDAARDVSRVHKLVYFPVLLFPFFIKMQRHNNSPSLLNPPGAHV